MQKGQTRDRRFISRVHVPRRTKPGQEVRNLAPTEIRIARASQWETEQHWDRRSAPPRPSQRPPSPRGPQAGATPGGRRQRVPLPAAGRFFLEIFAGVGHLSAAVAAAELREAVPIDTLKEDHFDATCKEGWGGSPPKTVTPRKREGRRGARHSKQARTAKYPKQQRYPQGPKPAEAEARAACHPRRPSHPVLPQQDGLTGGGAPTDKLLGEKASRAARQ